MGTERSEQITRICPIVALPQARLHDRRDNVGYVRAHHIPPLSYSVRMLPSRLLSDPLPDPLPSPGSGRFRRLRASLAANLTAPQLSLEELVDRRVRRGGVQTLMREAYEATVAGQDSARRKPRIILGSQDGSPAQARR